MYLENIINSLNKNKNIFFSDAKKNNVLLVKKELNFNFSEFYYNKDYYTKFLIILKFYLQFLEGLTGKKAEVVDLKFSPSNLKKKNFYNLKILLRSSFDINSKDFGNFFLFLKIFFKQIGVISNFLKLDFSMNLSKKINRSFILNLENSHFVLSSINNNWLKLQKSSVYFDFCFDEPGASFFFFKLRQLVTRPIKGNEKI